MPRYKVVLTRVEYQRAEIEFDDDTDLDPETQEGWDQIVELAQEWTNSDDYDVVNAEEDTESVQKILVLPKVVKPARKGKK